MLATTVGLALAYLAALIVATPPNSWDSLSYHLSRAAFWSQSGHVGYIPDAYDVRMDGSPPNAELVLTSLFDVTRSERLVGFVQFVAALACSLGVYTLARRLAFPAREAAFGALVFLTLPVVLLQAPTTQNDLVAASGLTAAAVFLTGTSTAANGPRRARNGARGRHEGAGDLRASASPRAGTDGACAEQTDRPSAGAR